MIFKARDEIIKEYSCLSLKHAQLKCSKRTVFRGRESFWRIDWSKEYPQSRLPLLTELVAFAQENNLVFIFDTNEPDTASPYREAYYQLIYDTIKASNLTNPRNIWWLYDFETKANNHAQTEVFSSSFSLFRSSFALFFLLPHLNYFAQAQNVAKTVIENKEFKFTCRFTSRITLHEEQLKYLLLLFLTLFLFFSFLFSPLHFRLFLLLNSIYKFVLKDLQN